MEQFNKYKELKNRLNIVYKGINFNKVLAFDIWNWANYSHSFSIKHLIYFVISLNLKNFKTCSCKNTILTTYGLYNRNDHNELYNIIIDKLGDNAVNNNLLRFKKKVKIDLKIIIFFTKQIFLKLQKSNFSFIDKLIITARFTYYAGIFEEFQRHDFNTVKKYLAFCGILDVENLLTQFLQQKGIKTFSLQHGITFIYSKDIPIDSINYENFQSDILLCWGQYNIDEYSKYGIPSDKLIVAGYPKTVKKIALDTTNKFKSCLVLLARNQYDESNRKLLSILLKQYDFEFYLKLHPSLNYEDYTEFAEKNNIKIINRSVKLLSCFTKNKYDFTIAINTSSYYEALMHGKPCLRFYDESFELMYGCDDIFSDNKGFEKALNKIKNNITNYQEKINSVLDYTMGIGTDNYKTILNDDSILLQIISMDISENL
jgi:hypothetical protein